MRTGLLAWLLAPCVLQAQVEITFVRHAESEANATGRYNSKTLNVLSAKGKEQVKQLTKELGMKRFDMIAISPAGRAIQTIVPFLRASGQTGTIWPELNECCHEKGAARKIPAGKMGYGATITIPEIWQAVVKIDPNHSKFVNVSNYQEGMIQVRMSYDRLKSEFKNHKRILLVGHSLAGARLFTLLFGKEKPIKIDNAKIYQFRQLPNGTFELVKP
jgi:broad specificity phosphatase PhoE